MSLHIAVTTLSPPSAYLSHTCYWTRYFSWLPIKYLAMKRSTCLKYCRWVWCDVHWLLMPLFLNDHFRKRAVTAEVVGNYCRCARCDLRAVCCLTTNGDHVDSIGWQMVGRCNLSLEISRWVYLFVTLLCFCQLLTLLYHTRYNISYILEHVTSVTIANTHVIRRHEVCALFLWCASNS